MNGSLGRDRVWNDHIWGEIDKAIREEVGRIRVAQKVFPSTVVNNVLPVFTTRVVPFGTPSASSASPVPGDDEFRPLFEISTQFVLTQAQVDGEENVHLAPSLARLAASAIANAEDAILFLGEKGIPAGVDVTNRAAIPPGFVAEAAYTKAAYTPVPPQADILTAVAEGIAALNTDAQPGPYALFVSPKRYAQTFAPTSGGYLLSPGDQLNHILTGGFYIVNSLADPNIGILVSLGGEPAKIILGTEAMTAFIRIDEKGYYYFRVFERIQLVVRDGRAFRTLNIQPPPPTPSLSTLSPSSAVAGGAAFTLTVTGSNFVNDSAVQWNGAARTTTFVSATQLTAQIPKSDIKAVGTASVTVLNQSVVSNALPFTIT